MKKIGIITYHNSYNCGSMLESYAIYNKIKEYDPNCEIIDFSTNGQKELYGVFNKNNNLKNILKNILIFPFRKRIEFNNKKYEEFKNNNFKLSQQKDYESLNDKEYSTVISGSDQIWNTTVVDFDDAYFLNWVKSGKKIAYAPSFGAKNPIQYSDDIEKYKKYLKNYDALSIREKNGQKWINDMIQKKVDILIDPTLFYNSDKYDEILDNSCTPKDKYIFFYCPGFNRNLCKFVKKVSKKYNLPVICWSSKSYSVKMIYTFGFKLPKYESPSVYLSLIKNAELIFTTSFHGTIFSTIYRKNFYTLKNGEMFGNDDRVKTLLEQLNLMNRLENPNFDKNKNYLEKPSYNDYEKSLKKLRKQANDFLKNNIGDMDETNK